MIQKLSGEPQPITTHCRMKLLGFYHRLRIRGLPRFHFTVTFLGSLTRKISTSHHFPRKHIHMIYELWHSQTAGCHTFFPSGSAAADQLEPDAVLIWTTDAESWEEAQRQKHEFLGWEPDVPMDDE